MSIEKRVVIGETPSGKKYFANERKNSMARAVAVRFLFEMILTPKWDHLFKDVWIKVSEESFSIGSPVETEGYQNALSRGHIPRLLAPDFLIRVDQTGNTLAPTEVGVTRFSFYGVDKDDSICVFVSKVDGKWKPVGIDVFLLAKARRHARMLLTNYVPITT